MFKIPLNVFPNIDNDLAEAWLQEVSDANHPLERAVVEDIGLRGIELACHPAYVREKFPFHLLNGASVHLSALIDRILEVKLPEIEQVLVIN